MGDAFGGSFFWKTDAPKLIEARELSPAVWKWSDDTAMSRAVVNCLFAHEKVLPDAFARLLAEEYHREPTRGYGTGAHTILDEIWQGVPWREAAGKAFDGKGSLGNGASMRVAPLGAYFAGDVWRVIDEARRQAMVTHAHPEGQAGAIAVALAASWVVDTEPLDGRAMLEWVWTYTPEGDTRAGLKRALELPFEETPEAAAALLGSGEKVTAQDTVPFALWCAARHLLSFPEALWATVAGGGDMDTTCAIVGGIVSLCATEGIPKEWNHRAEPVEVVSEAWWSRWHGWTETRKMAPEGASYYFRLFDAAKVYDWSAVFQILGERKEIHSGYAINTFRPNEPSWYTLLHYAVQGDAPTEVVQELLAKGHLRAIRCAQGERPVDLAKRLERSNLVPLLEPVLKHDIPLTGLRVLEQQFHKFILDDPGDNAGHRLPSLEVLLERSDLTMSFFLPSRFGGYVYRLHKLASPVGFDGSKEDWVLLLKDFDRMGDTERYYVVTPYGSLLMSKGWEDDFQ
jgi:ADP-ribosylglycohydrolase